jgi:hypothetical protein
VERRASSPVVFCSNPGSLLGRYCIGVNEEGASRPVGGDARSTLTRIYAAPFTSTPAHFSSKVSVAA